MTSLKQLAQYCRDYIDLISPSLLSGQAKQTVLPRDVLDATPLYEKTDTVDYESLTLALNLEPKIAELDAVESADDIPAEDTAAGNPGSGSEVPAEAASRVEKPARTIAVKSAADVVDGVDAPAETASSDVSDMQAIAPDPDGVGEPGEPALPPGPPETAEREKLEIAKALDDIYRKYETSSYTKQITLRFGRVAFSARPTDEASAVSKRTDGYDDVEQHLFSVPVSIGFKDTGGARHYSLTVEDTIITTNTGLLNGYLTQEQRDDLFRFISENEADEKAGIPIDPEYVDGLWSMITHFLTENEARDISDLPDMENTLVILLPKVNYFLSQDLLGIIDQVDELGDKELLDTSLSAWVSDQEMSVSDPAGDDGSQELFFPFAYDESQLQVLGKLGNRAAVVEGPPGTGKSQTIANILCHLAANGKKVLFVSQKDQAVRGVKDKLKSLDIPYLYGYLPDRSSRLHTEEDERDSAANALKGIAQALYTPVTPTDPKLSLIRLHEYKPRFNAAIGEQREYFALHEEWAALDAYDFGDDALRINEQWLQEIAHCRQALHTAQQEVTRTRQAVADISKTKAGLEVQAKGLFKQMKEQTALFADRTGYPWLALEQELMRNLGYTDVAGMMHAVMESFDRHVVDRKHNFIKTALHNLKLNKELDHTIRALPREMYESVRAIVFEESSKTQRLLKLREITEYFGRKAGLSQELETIRTEYRQAEEQSKRQSEELEVALQTITDSASALGGLVLDDVSMERIHTLLAQATPGDRAAVFAAIHRRHELTGLLAAFRGTAPNDVNEQIMREKQQYASHIREYLQHRLSERVEEYRQVKQYRAALESIGRKLGKTKKAYKTFDSLKSNPFNFEAMSGIIPIWMMGLDDASRVLPLTKNIFDYVIIDEASQCNISYALPAMYRSRHTILFGDTLQMRDTTTAFKSNERLEAIAKKHSIPEDLQIKATEDAVKSVMDIAKLSGFQTTVLRNHYRSPMELIGFSNEWFYAPRGRRLQVVNDDILAMPDGRVLKNHVIEPNLDMEVSDKTNLSEAFYIKKLIDKIKKDPQTADKSVAVLTFFNEQAELIRKVVTDDAVKVAIIEGIQGDERDIVIYSFVIKTPQEKSRYVALTGESGEIRKEVNEGRVNVAFSRARLQVHAVTSLAPNLWPEGIWVKRYLEYVETKGRVTRLAKAKQQFDSKFESDVYDFLATKLDAGKYTLTTQVESCGFRIDLVVRDVASGRKLAIECDGPTHFEAGDGQVRVANDYERQSVLETAGWRFYRLSYYDWQEGRAQAEKDLLQAISDFMHPRKKKRIESVQVAATDDAGDGDVEEPEIAAIGYTYTTEKVEIPAELVEALKTSMAARPKRAFGRKAAPKPDVAQPEDGQTRPLPGED